MFSLIHGWGRIFQEALLNDNKIGILAGMGPRSTAPFIDMVVTQCQDQYGARQLMDFPAMMISSLPVPMVMGEPLDDAILEPLILNGLRELEAAGATVIAMPCNTIHRYHSRLQATIKGDLLNIIDAAVAQVPESSRCVSLLATRWTVEADLYQARLIRAGKQIKASEDWQKRIDHLIEMGLSSQNLEEARGRWDALLTEMKGEGVDHCILACTDLNSIGGGTPEGLSLIDATSSLAQALVRTWREKALSPAAPEHIQ